MNTRAATVLILVAAGAAGRATKNLSLGESVTVCMETPTPAVPTAQLVASWMFEKIGVRIHWVIYGNCPPEGIRITLQTYDNLRLEAGALAYAMPFQRRDIVIHYGRIREFGKDLESRLLAHVLAHEITHMLQGVVRHSEEGLMKATWTPGDRSQMLHNWTLPFTREDIRLIHIGIDSRRHGEPD